MRANKGRFLWPLFFILIFAGGITGGYLYFSYFSKAPSHKPVPPARQLGIPQKGTAFSDIRLYFPVEGRIVTEEKAIQRQTSISAIADATVEEFLKGPSNAQSSGIPAGARLLGTYLGSDGILYVDLSSEFSRNFQGDALSEFLLLKSLYESVISNVQGINDVKILIEGKETDSIGGHISARYPLKNILAETKSND